MTTLECFYFLSSVMKIKWKTYFFLLTIKLFYFCISFFGILPFYPLNMVLLIFEWYLKTCHCGILVQRGSCNEKTAGYANSLQEVRQVLFLKV